MSEIILDLTSSEQERWFAPSGSGGKSPFERVLGILRAEKVNKSMLIKFDWSQPLEIPADILRAFKAVTCKKEAYIENAQSIDDSNLDIFLENNFHLIIHDKVISSESAKADKLFSMPNSKQLYISDIASDMAGFPFDKLNDINCLVSYLLGLEKAGFYSASGDIMKMDNEVVMTRIVRNLDRLAYTKANFIFHCGLPLCFFSGKNLGTLISYGFIVPLANCVPQCVINAEGDVSFCSAFGNSSVCNIFNLNSYNSAVKSLHSWRMPYTSFCAGDNTEECRSRLTNACWGGCHYSNINEWNS